MNLGWKIGFQQSFVTSSHYKFKRPRFFRTFHAPPHLCTYELTYTFRITIE